MLVQSGIITPSKQTTPLSENIMAIIKLLIDVTFINQDNVKKSDTYTADIGMLSPTGGWTHTQLVSQFNSFCEHRMIELYDDMFSYDFNAFNARIVRILPNGTVETIIEDSKLKYNIYP